MKESVIHESKTKPMLVKPPCFTLLKMQNKPNFPHIQLKNKVYSKNKAKPNPFLGFPGSCVLGSLCRLTKRTQM
jgi:hypothetical protein